MMSYSYLFVSLIAMVAKLCKEKDGHNCRCFKVSLLFWYSGLLDVTVVEEVKKKDGI